MDSKLLWSAKNFQMSLTKHLELQANNRNQTNIGGKRFYFIGESSEQYILLLKEKKKILVF